MKKIILLALLATVVFSCTKEKYQSSFDKPIHSEMYQDVTSYVPKVISRDGDTLIIKTVDGFIDRFSDNYKWYNWDRVIADVEKGMSYKDALFIIEQTSVSNRVIWNIKSRIRVHCYEGRDAIWSDLFIINHGRTVKFGG